MRPLAPIRWPRWIRAVVVLQLLLLAAAGVCYLLTRLEPSWWRDPKPQGPATASTAEQVESGVVAQLSLARPSDPQHPAPNHGYQSGEWSVSITAEDADAWLATRLKQWIENQGGRWPDQLTGAQVEFAPGVIKAGVRLDTGGQSRIVVIELAPEVRADGSLWFTPKGMAAGAMPLPAALVMQEVREAMLAGMPAGSARRTQAQQALDILAGKQPALKDAVVKLDDGRSVRLLRFVPVAGRIELTCRTEKIP
jgi:hypothetical protein